jgi:hypothetical protein
MLLQPAPILYSQAPFLCIAIIMPSRFGIAVRKKTIPVQLNYSFASVIVGWAEN